LSAVLLVGADSGRRRGANGSKQRKLFEALQADEDSRGDDALRLVREAREGEPLNHELALHEATFLWNLGQVEIALAAYAEAARLSPESSGTAHHWLAIRLARLGRDEEGLVNVVEALRREPTLIGEVDHDEIFSRWKNDSAYREALEVAFLSCA
jgi:tetratricopeptide (TPR) repeat protein